MMSSWNIQMITISASLVLRPTRIGFLVEPNDSTSLRRIFQTNACLWGGVFNPIIPVSNVIPEAWRGHENARGPTPTNLAKGYLDFFEPDVFVEAQPGLGSSIGLQTGNLDLNHPRVLPLDSFFEPGSHENTDVPFGTNIFHLYEDLYEREFKFVPRHERRIAIMANDSENAPFVEATFGGFPDTGPLVPLSQAYLDAFDPVKLAPTAENWNRIVTEGFRTPLELTRQGLKREHGGRSRPTLFVVDALSPLDLIDLWNIRLFHPQILAVNLSWFTASKELLVDYLGNNYRSSRGNPHGAMNRTIIQFGRSIPEERATATLEESGIRGAIAGAWTSKFWYDNIWGVDRDDFVVRPRRARIVAAAQDIELAIPEDGPDLRCQFTSLSPEFVETYGAGSARWANVLKFQSYGAKHALALTLPSSFTGVNSNRMRLGEATIVSREGFVLPQQYKQHREYFSLLTGREAVVSWLKSHGVEAEPSDPGRVADQIFDSLDGFRGIRLIAHRDTITLLDEMSKSVRKHTDGTLEEFPDRSAEVHRWQQLVHRRANTKFGYRVSLDSFIKANVLTLGLVLECPNCRKKNWYGIQELREQLRCERCLKSYAFPQGSLRFDRAPWHYRVVGPYSVPNYAEGAYATVLAINALASGLAGDKANVTFSTGLHVTIGSTKPSEVDFTLWYQRRRILDLEDEPVLVFGEAKSFATKAFVREDVERMQMLAEKFPGVVLTFATLKDSLSDAEKELIRPVAIWGRQRLPDGKPRASVIVLTGIELFSTWRIEQSWKDLGGQHERFIRKARGDLSNIWEFAEFTQQLYLDMPDPERTVSYP
jgi:hypothetical protein